MKVSTIVAGAALALAACVALPTTSHAEILRFAPHERSIITEDGWEL